MGLGNPTCSDHQGHIWGAVGKGVIPAPGPGSSSACQLYIRERFRFWSRKKKKKARAYTPAVLSLPPSLGPFTQKHTFSMTFFNEIFDNIAAQEFTALFPCEIFGSFLAFAVHAAVRSRDRLLQGRGASCSSHSGCLARPQLSFPQRQAPEHPIFLSPLPEQLCLERCREDVPSSMGVCVRTCVWR